MADLLIVNSDYAIKCHHARGSARAYAMGGAGGRGIDSPAKHDVVAIYKPPGLAERPDISLPVGRIGLLALRDAQNLIVGHGHEEGYRGCHGLMETRQATVATHRLQWHTAGGAQP